MTKTFLISEQVLRTYTDISNNVDTELIKNAIREAGDIGLQAIVGTLLYQKLVTLVDSGDINNEENANYKTLLTDYIQDYLIYASYWYSLDAIYLRSRNNGLIKPMGGENSEGVERELYNLKRQSIENKMSYYAERLTKYIIEEQGLYPEINNSNKLYEQNPNYNNKYKNGFVFRKSPFTSIMERAGIPIYDARYKQYPPN